MAAQFASSSFEVGLSRIKGIFDISMEDLICGSEDVGNEDFVKKITAGFTKNALLETRRKLYDVAMSVHDGRRTKGSVAKDALRSGSVDCLSKGSHCDTGRGLVNRRVKPAVASDISDLSVYIRDTDSDFPVHMVKRAPVDRKISNKPKESVVDDDNISLIENVNESDVSLDSASEIRSEGGEIDSPQTLRERYIITEEVAKSDSDNPSVSIVALKESGTSTSDLCSYRSISTQTDEEIPQTGGVEIAPTIRAEIKYPRHPSPDTNPPSELQVPLAQVSQENRPPENTVDSNASMMDPNDPMFELSQKLNRLDKKMNLIEREHMFEIMSLKSEQATLRAEFSDALGKRQSHNNQQSNANRAGNPPCSRERMSVKEDIAAISSSNATDHAEEGDWGDYRNTNFVFTQDSQGVTVVTRETPAHQILRKYRPDAVNASDVVIDPIPPNGPCNPPQKVVTYVKADPTPAPQQARRAEQFDNGTKKPQQIKKLPSSDTGPARGQVSVTTRHVAQKGKNSDSSGPNTGATRRRATAQDMFNDERQLSADNVGALAKRQRLEGGVDLYDVDNGSAVDTKGNSKCSTSVSDSDDCMDDQSEKSPSKGTFAEMAAKNSWKVVSYSKSPEQKKGTLPTISGSDDSDTKELYVQGLSVRNYRKHKELEDAVKEYCGLRSVKTQFQRVVVYKNNRKTVGCRIVVCLEDVDKVYARGFWPRGVHIREWYNDKPDEKDKYFVSCSESDENQ